MRKPPLEEIVGHLLTIVDLEEIDVDTPVQDLEIDSLDLIEWMFLVEEECDITVEVEELDGMQSATIRDIHQLLLQLVEAQSGGVPV